MNRLRIALLSLLPLLGLPLVAAGPATAGPVLTHGVAFSDAEGPLVPWPEYAADVDRYALPTTAATAGAVTVTPTTDDPAGGTIEVNGQPVSSGSSIELTGLVSGDEISVIFHEGAVTTAQSWFYLPVGFPELHSSGSASDTPVFLTLGSFTGLPYETIVDRHGVPVYAAQTRSSDFKAAAHDPTHFSIARTSPSSPAPPLPAEYEIVELDEQLRPIRSVQLDGSPEATDFHDAQFLADGGALLMGYGVSTHPDGKRYIDAIIQVVDATGHAIFTWNSKDHADVSEAYVDLPGTYGDYAHINSLQMLDNGDVLASFRNMSQIMRIATTAHDGLQPGDVVWRFGGKHSDFTIVGDPDNGFCAQHDARILPNGHLMLFDNGSRRDTVGPAGLITQTAAMCPDPTDPVNSALERPQTRVVEYSLDETGQVATYVGELSVPGRYAAFAGNAQRLANGNTFIGWSMSEPGSAPIASEMTPDNAEPWALFGPSTGSRYFTYRAFTYPAPDNVAPVVTSPLDGATLQDGVNVPSTYTCTDRGGSNLASCTGSTPAGQPLDTTPGQHTLTVTGTDGAGNTTSTTFTYTVTRDWKPDGWIRDPGQAWRGQDVYGGTAGQSLTFKVRAGGKAKAKVALQNDGALADRLQVTGTAGTAAISVRYYQGTTDITRAVTRGTYRTAPLGAGTKVVIKVVLTRNAKATKGDRLRAKVLIRSVGNSARVDNVAVAVRAT